MNRNEIDYFADSTDHFKLDDLTNAAAEHLKKFLYAKNKQIVNSAKDNIRTKRQNDRNISLQNKKNTF